MLGRPFLPCLRPCGDVGRDGLQQKWFVSTATALMTNPTTNLCFSSSDGLNFGLQEQMALKCNVSPENIGKFRCF